MGQRINRLKNVLAEKLRTNKWLAEQLEREYFAVLEWRTNANQSNLLNLTEIISLYINNRELLVRCRLELLIIK